jgi:DNA-binding transcriptional LysR family regulator
VLIQQLHYLTALARERHFGRAAETCHVSQPTLSSGVRKLEEELGVPLVRRGGHRFQELTPEGERMVQWAHRILAARDGMLEDLATMTSGLSGRLRLGAIPTAEPVVGLVTRQLLAEHPDVDVSVLSQTSREIEHGLRFGQLDVGLTYLENEPLSDVRTLPLYRERYVVVSPEHTDRKSMTWAEAAALPLCLLTPDMQNRRIVDAILQTTGSLPSPVVETNSIAALYTCVREGLGWAVMAHTWPALLGVADELSAIPLTRPDVEQAIGLVWLERDPEPLLVRAAIASARKAVATGLVDWP